MRGDIIRFIVNTRDMEIKFQVNDNEIATLWRNDDESVVSYSWKCNFFVRLDYRDMSVTIIDFDMELL